MDAKPEHAPTKLSIVVPVFNEHANLEPFWDRLSQPLARLPESTEIIFVDDGSTDGSAATITRLAQRDPRLRLVRLSRNFGHQAALLAGLEAARGDAVISLDGDLQHPPELIPELVTHWRNGAEVVQTIRRQPADLSPLKRAGSRGFYRLLSWLTRLNVTPGAADYRLLARPALDALLACRERCRFNRGLVQWIGFDYVEVPYEAEKRHAGASKYTLRSMLRLAGDAIFSFSSWPLRLAGLAGASITIPAGLYLLFVLYARLFTNYVEPGWSSILATVLILGGMNLLVLWILGEYVGRMYEEVKQRPVFIVRPDTRGPTQTAATSSTRDAADITAPTPSGTANDGASASAPPASVDLGQD